ncbi:hypothetical protein [Brevundimonas sp.]|uniref:hypothetical protein n=1 Tax=Brevundimonas sp. TaxID=1871086 RepID=UPI002737CF9B|nr:hypothetical protein [Brevundimonas sp.]MDP3801413.1 hypothetical protein [Brevundimonas sp.]
MDHFRLRKYRGPEVWARVRLAYEAGESGPSVARRFDVGLANLRKKCRREGWSRRHQAERSDRDLPGERIAAAGAEAPPAPDEVRRRAVDRAAALLAEGRAAEALVQLKAAEALARLDAVDGTPEPTEEEEEAVRLKVGQIVEDRAVELAHEMLAEGVRPGVRWGGFALRWRAQTYGAGAAEADRRAAEAEGWADRYWDADGRLREREPGEM